MIGPQGPGKGSSLVLTKTWGPLDPPIVSQAVKKSGRSVGFGISVLPHANCGEFPPMHNGEDGVYVIDCG